MVSPRSFPALRSGALACLLFLLLAGSAWPQEPVPPLQSRVTDRAGMLNESQRAALDNVLREHETRTGSQIAVLLVRSTAPESIEQYGIRVADAWKPGRKEVDDGVILIVARDNPRALRRLRLEVGQGVEGLLTDARSRQILEDVIAPHFRQNDFYGGLAAGVSAIIAVLDKEKLPPPKDGSPAAGQDAEEAGWIATLLPVLFFFLLLSLMSRGRHSRRAFGSNDWGNHAGVILGAGLGSMLGRGGGGLSGGGGFSGGGGGFSGGGASGDW